MRVIKGFCPWMATLRRVAAGACRLHIDRARTTSKSIHHCRDGPAFIQGLLMAWAILFVAGLLEVGWAVGLKYTEGFTKLVPSVLTLTSMAASVGMLALALKELPMGTAYAVWTGIGAVGTAALGIYLFGDPATVARIACIGLIVAGIAGLKLVS
jgi:quaternary ammonium compound-resistance protein SugE